MAAKHRTMKTPMAILWATSRFCIPGSYVGASRPSCESPHGKYPAGSHPAARHRRIANRPGRLSRAGASTDYDWEAEWAPAERTMLELRERFIAEARKDLGARGHERDAARGNVLPAVRCPDG